MRPAIEDLRCPRCGGHVTSSFTCHTYPGGTRSDGTTQWMACWGCDSATEFECTGKVHPDDYDFEDTGCGWVWTWGLNPGNPRAVANAEREPKTEQWAFAQEEHS